MLIVHNVNIFPEIKIIDTDGLWIKKEQLDVLQKEFSEKSILSNKKIYIINHADRLNKSSANSILKFLEEPEENIIAILTTDNMYQMLDTIISRCQIISFSRKNELYEELPLNKIKNYIAIPEQLTEEMLENIIGQAIEFTNYYEKNGMDTILKTQKLWHNNFKEKDIILLAINIMILYYQDILNLKLDRSVKIFKNYNLEELVNKNTVRKLTKKISVLIKTKDKINFNVNSQLLIDKLIIELERCD